MAAAVVRQTLVQICAAFGPVVHPASLTVGTVVTSRRVDACALGVAAASARRTLVDIGTFVHVRVNGEASVATRARGRAIDHAYVLRSPARTGTSPLALCEAYSDLLFLT